MRSMIQFLMISLAAICLSVAAGPPAAGAAETLQRLPAQRTLQPVPGSTTTKSLPTAMVQVHSVSPTSRPALTAGGDDVTVTLSGTNLNLITEARVMLNGGSVSNVTASLGSSGTTSRQVTITAQPGAATGSYQVQLKTGTQTINPITAVVSAPAASRTTAGIGTKGGTATAFPDVGLSPGAQTRQPAAVPYSASTAGKTPLKTDATRTLDTGRAVQTQPMAGAAVRDPGTGVRGTVMNAEKGAAVSERLTQMRGEEGLKGGLEQPGSGAQGFEALGLGERGDLSARLNQRRPGGGTMDLGPLGSEGDQGSQAGGGIGDLLNTGSRSNPKTMPAFTPGAGDSRLMSGTWGGTTSSEDRMGSDGSQSVGSVEYYFGSDGSIQVVTTSTNKDGSVNQSNIHIDNEGNVTEENSTTSTSSGESSTSTSTSGGNGSSSSTSSGSSSSTSGGSSGSSGSSSSSSGETSTSSSGETSTSSSGDDGDTGDPDETPNPDDSTGGGGRTWDQLTDEEKEQICDEYERQRASVMGGMEGGSTVNACAESPNGPDFKELMEIALNPYILHDNVEQSDVPVPVGPAGPSDQGTQPAPIDPDPDITGGDLIDIPGGGQPGQELPGGGGNPDRQ